MSQPLTTIELTELADILQEGGFRAEFDLSDPEAPFLRSGSQGLYWRLDIAKDDDELSTRLEYWMALGVANETVATKVCRAFNMDSPVGNAFHDTVGEDNDVMVIIQHFAFLAGGVTREWIAEDLSRWDLAVSTAAAKRVEYSDTPI